jgi:ATP-dependent DNA helicase RecQ
VITPVPGTPGLLVDDMVDSRWTLTTIGVALREAGSGPVFPFVLAQAVSG